MRNHAHMWVLRDLSNGDGADPGVVYPKYLWVFYSRAEARWKRREHAKRGLARLGPPQTWAAATIANLYKWVAPNYRERKRRRHGRIGGV